MKKQLLILLMTLLPMVASADAVEIDGIYYNLISKVNIAEVISNPNKYTGIIIIPETVTYNNVSYSVTTIGKSAFRGCTGLTSITIPNSVTSIVNGAFEGCTGLTSIIIPNSVISIGDYAFWDCSSLTSITIGNSVTSIGSQVFYECSSLTSITIPDGVTSIGSGAFEFCRGLISVTIPNSVTSIGMSAFWGCTGLTTITIPNSVTSIRSSTFSGCTGISSITIPNSVISIDQEAFEGCIALTSISIPNSVTSIGYQAFYGCKGLTSLTIGDRIKTVSAQAFALCSELTEVYCYAENVLQTENDAFKDSYIEYATLHVPTSSVNLYQQKEPWSGFKSIVAISGNAPENSKCATPIISFGGKKLFFNCETDGVEYVYEIKDVDVKKGYANTVELTGTYEISVYATKTGYENSDVATATLTWTNASFTDTTPRPSSVRTLPQEIPVLISSRDGMITVKCEADGQYIYVYNVGGQLLGTGIINDGQASVATSLQKGDIFIVKVGQNSVKFSIK